MTKTFRAVRGVSERREEILALAGEMFAAKGFATTTVREIADAAGILSGSLYHHFDSKESMVDEILVEMLDATVDNYRITVAAGGDPIDVLRGLIRQAFAAIGEHRTAIAVMQNEFNYLVQFPRFAYLRKAADEVERLWVDVVKRGQESGAFRPDVDARLLYRFMRDTIWVTVRWYQPGAKYSIDEIADTYLGVLLDGVAARGRVRARSQRP